MAAKKSKRRTLASKFDAVKFVDGFHAWLQQQLAPWFKRIQHLEQKSLADWYRGVWRSGQSHERGNLVTDKGALWLCLSDTTARPGTNKDWRLVAKGGKPT